MEPLDPSSRTVLTSLANDYKFFARNALKIIDKSGEVRPFIFNRAQEYLHSIVEEQKKRTGMVRIVVLKGRQQGCTTYIQGRLFHRVHMKNNQSAFVLAHQAESTLKIFSMAQKFRQYLSQVFQTPLTKDTERSMILENGSGYTVGTAGSAQVGRGMTVQLFHGSEVGFYENADQLATGLMQTVPDMAGTEVFFESTANGPGNFFYNLVMGAIGEKNGYKLVFIPWYWQEEYQYSIPLKLSELDKREKDLYDLYAEDGLTLYHLAWRRRKITALGGPDHEWKFIQEYPFNVEEAFVKAQGRFYDMAIVYQARKRTVTRDISSYALCIGVDQGRTGDDTVIFRRQGPKCFPIEKIPADDGDQRDMRLASRLAQILDRESPDIMSIDVTNEHGTLDRLHEMGYSKRQVKGVHFGEKATDPTRYRNKRVEMAFSSREWFLDPEAAIPDDQPFLSEIGSIPVEKESSNQVQYLVSKDEVKKDLGWSPNILDAFWLTFAWLVKKWNYGGQSGRSEGAKEFKVIMGRSTLRSRTR